MIEGSNNPISFGELPQSLVEKMLYRSREVGENLYKSIKSVKDTKEKMRKQLETSDRLRRDIDLGYPDDPTTCGIDGSFAADRLLSTDLVACAAVGVEGFVPQQEENKWSIPDHDAFIDYEPHEPESSSVVRGLMVQMEVRIACKAPHHVVFLDGSFTSRIIHMNQAVNEMKKTNYRKVAQEITNRFAEFATDFKIILASERSDKIWVSLPKYTSKKELGEEFEWDPNYDDRALLTYVLSSGEYTYPYPMRNKNDEEEESAETSMHLRSPYPDQGINDAINEILAEIDRLYVIYYRPHDWSPALRIEVPSSIANNDRRLAVLLRAVYYQCSNPSIKEPYPLYMADRMAKHLGPAMSAFRQAAFQKMIELGPEDITEIFYSMQSYRTEGGR